MRYIKPSHTQKSKAVAIPLSLSKEAELIRIRIFSVVILSFLLILLTLVSNQTFAQNVDKNKDLKVFQDKTYIGLASEDNIEIIYTQCGEPISTFYFDQSNGEPMLVMAGLYDIEMYQLTALKKNGNTYLLSYKDAKGNTQVAQLEADAKQEKIQLLFQGMKMSFIVKEKMVAFKVSDDCNEMRLATPSKN